MSEAYEEGEGEANEEDEREGRGRALIGVNGGAWTIT